MRDRPPVKLHRRQIAEAAGVAPGLVTYYFRDEPTLIEAAARPIIEAYLARLRALLEQSNSIESDLRQLVDLLIEIGRNNGHLLDAYIRYMKEENVPHRQDILNGAYGLIDILIRRGQQSGELREVNTAVMSTVIWGVCKTVSQLPELAASLQGGNEDQDGHSIVAAMIVDLLLRAMKPDAGPTAVLPYTGSSASVSN